VILAGTIAALADIVVICGSTASVGVNEREMSESDTEQFYWDKDATKHICGQYSPHFFALLPSCLVPEMMMSTGIEGGQK